VQALLVILLWWLVIPVQGLLLLHTLFNAHFLRRLRPTELSRVGISAPLPISVLIPARNEERRIHDCLSSLLAQEPAPSEIILLDDRSSDATAQIARSLGFHEGEGGEGHRLRLLMGKELPDGWVGKNWACHQLSQVADARNTHLLFTDADTIHASASLRTALAYAESERLDLLSLWPDQITASWSEKLVIPLGYLVIVCFQPFALLSTLQAKPERVRRWGVSREQLASMGVANGQFLLFRRAAYELIGGHEALRDHLVEDLAFGRRIAARTGEGMRLTNGDGTALLRCRMYTCFQELWEGFSKNMRPAFEESILSFLIFGFLITSFFLLPFLLLPLSYFFHGLLEPACLAVALIFATRLFLTLRYKSSWLSLCAHPIALLLMCSIALNSWRLCLGGGVSWKGRTYSGATKGSLE